MQLFAVALRYIYTPSIAYITFHNVVLSKIHSKIYRICNGNILCRHARRTYCTRLYYMLQGALLRSVYTMTLCMRSSRHDHVHVFPSLHSRKLIEDHHRCCSHGSCKYNIVLTTSVTASCASTHIVARGIDNKILKTFSTAKQFKAEREKARTAQRRHHLSRTLHIFLQTERYMCGYAHNFSRAAEAAEE